MFTTIGSIASLLLATMLLMLGNGLMSSLVGIRLDSAETASWLLGLVGASYFAGLTLGSLNAFRTIAAVGHVRSFTAFASIYSAAMLLHAVILDPMLWIALRLAGGYCMAGLYMCLESWLNARATKEMRGRVLAYYAMSTYAAMGVAQGFLALPDTSGFLLFVVASLTMSMALVPVALTRIAQPALPNVNSFSFFRLYKVSPLGVVGTFVAGLVTGAFYTLGAVYGRRLGLGLDQIALLMVIAILSGFFLQWPIGYLADRFDRRRVIIALCFGLTLTSLGMTVGSRADLVTLFASAAAFGAVSSTLYPMCVAYVNDWIDPHDLISAAGGLVLTYSAGAIFGPIVASAMMDPTVSGPGGLFLFSAVVSALGGLFGTFRLFARSSVPLEEQAHFQIAARTTPAATALDTRGEDDDQLSFDFEAMAVEDEGVEPVPPGEA